MFEERINDPESDESQVAADELNDAEDIASMSSSQDSEPIPSDPPQNT
jgi:hypothetical protein